MKRFLNADSYGSTGQGFLGYNMFAYCNNNPVCSKDPKGECLLTALAIGFGVGLLAQYAGDVVDNVNSGETGLDVLVPHSSVKDYFASGIGCAIASTPGGFWATVGWGAAGSLTTDLIKGNLNNRKDVLTSASVGAGANAVGWLVQKGFEFLKVSQVKGMPRTDRKRFLLEEVFQNSHGFTNCNLRTFGQATLKEQMGYMSKSLFVFKAGVYSNFSSGLVGKIWELVDQ